MRALRCQLGEIAVMTLFAPSALLTLDKVNTSLRPSDIEFRPNAGDANEG